MRITQHGQPSGQRGLELGDGQEPNPLGRVESK
jgi:hypothetical protein